MGEFSSFQPLKTWIADRKSKTSKMDKIGSEKATPKPKVSKRTNKTKADYYFKCAFCPAEVDDDAKLKIHIESKHLKDLFKFPCETCGFDAEGPRVLREHIAKVHGGQKGQTVQIPKVEKNHKVEDIASNSPISKVKKEAKVEPKIKSDPKKVEVSLKPKQPQVENKDVKKASEVKSELDLAVNEETTIVKIVNDDAS